MASVKKVTVKVRDSNKPGGWRLEPRYRVTYRDQDGKPGKATFKRRAPAEVFCSDTEHAVRAGTYVAPSAGRQTFAQYVDQWRLDQVHYATNTATLVDSHLRVHILPAFGPRPIASVRTSHVQSWVRELSKKLAPATVEAVYGRLVTVMRAATEERVIARSPCTSKIKLPKVIRVPVVPLLAEAVELLAEEMPERYQALVAVGFGLGLRQGEAFGLTPGHVDFLRRSVRVDQQVILPSGCPPEVAGLKTQAFYRTLPLPAVVAEALARHLEQFEPGQSGLIFTADNGEPLRRNRFDEVFNRAVGRSGARAGTTFHDLRHFYASALIFAGQSVKVVQARLGHASALETLDTYSHLWPDDEDGSRKAIDGLFATVGRVETTGSVAN